MNTFPYFSEVRDPRVIPGIDIFEEVDAGHGQIETRKCSILPAKDYLMDETLALWKNLSTIIRIKNKYTSMTK